MVDTDTLTAVAEVPETETGTTRKMVLNMGPQHPSTHGVLRIILELDGETITKAVPEIGFLHTGIEKQCETRTWQQVVPLTDRTDYLANLSNNLGYCLAVEKLLQVEIPARAQFMRVMLAEVTRINSHLVWLGTSALDVGAMSVFFYCFREREEILRLFEFFSGQRLMTSYFRIGGLALDAPRGWQKWIAKFLKVMPSRIEMLEGLLNENPIFKRRTQGIGYISLDDMLDLSVTGPMLRAAGLKVDARKDHPYSGYDKFDFNVPTLTQNDVYARYLIRMEEMKQSLRIIQQAYEGMPNGPYTADAPHVVLPDREKMKTQMESLIYHFKIVTEGFRVPAGEAYSVIESPRGELVNYVVSDGTSKPHRVFLRTPSFGNLQALPTLFEGFPIADSIASLGGMDFVLGDTDR
ncbi:MAG: NADH dehydrogenase (quinone) subunit D [Candidatus Solibacter usitatus]|nr:NADH dehydrogenase (quinone) subunit D [Candidatus Solibacter usitatus]